MTLGHFLQDASHHHIAVIIVFVHFPFPYKEFNALCITAFSVGCAHVNVPFGNSAAASLHMLNEFREEPEYTCSDLKSI